MKTLILKTAIICFAMYSPVFSQNNKLLKQISDSLPGGWTATIDTSKDIKIIIQSSTVDLTPDMTSNDPPELKGQCEIYLLLVSLVPPDSIATVRKKNKEMKDQLPPQVSKDNIGNWYKQNEKALKIIDSGPTHYDNNYSYRINCRRLPKNEKDLVEYNKILSYLNKQFTKYRD
jgi:hypothetical protein